MYLVVKWLYSYNQKVACSQCDEHEQLVSPDQRICSFHVITAATEQVSYSCIAASSGPGHLQS